MKHCPFVKFMVLLCALGVRAAWCGAPAAEAEHRKTAHDIFKQLIEINTTDSVGSTTVAAQAMAQRLLDAGFAAGDVTVIGPNERKGNMVARYRGKTGSKLRPVLIIGHLDVVEAARIGPRIRFNSSSRTAITMAAERRT